MVGKRLCGRHFVLAVLLSFGSLATQADAQVSVRDLGTLGAPSAECYGINNKGQAVGASRVPAGQTHAFLWTPGGTDGIPGNEQMKDLGTLSNAAGSYGSANAINSFGLVVGYSSDPFGHAILWSPKGQDGSPNNPQMKDLGAIGGSGGNALGINSAGHVVGLAETANSQYHAFLWIQGATDGASGNEQMKDLGTLGGTFSRAMGINDSDQVAGYSYTAEGTIHAFLWTAGGTDGPLTNPQMKDLGAVDGLSSYAYGINNAGQTVGYLEHGDGSHSPFIWTPGAKDGIPGNEQMKDLGTLGGLSADGYAINSGGAVAANVNYSNVTGSIWTPMTPNGTVGDVTTSGVSLGGTWTSAQSINDFGVIAGYGTLPGDPIDPNFGTVYHAFIAEPNRPPVAQSQDLSATEDSSAAVTLSATDPNGSQIAAYEVVDAPAHGMLFGTAPNLLYIPDHDFNGTDSFTFRASDGSAFGNSATVTIHVAPVNDPPVAFSVSYVVNEDSSIALGLPVIDVDGDPLGYIVDAQPQHGTLTGYGNSLVYTPAPNFNGTDSFTYYAVDPFSTSNVATITIAVLPVNDAPVATDLGVSVDQDTATSFSLLASDVDGDPLSYIIVSGPSHGTLSAGTGASRTYTPAAGFKGSDSFTFKVNDGKVDSNIATVYLGVNGVNHPPVANDQSVSLNQDTSRAITLTASDPDGDALNYILVTLPSHGTLTGSGANQTYVPAAGYRGTDSFTFKVKDAKSESNIATVSINVLAVNHAPVAVNDTATTKKGTAVTINVVANDTDSDGDALSVTAVTQSTNGTATISSNRVVFTPKSGFTGAATFTYTISDGHGGSATATVTVNVTK